MAFVATRGREGEVGGWGGRKGNDQQEERETCGFGSADSVVSIENEFSKNREDFDCLRNPVKEIFTLTLLRTGISVLLPFPLALMSHIRYHRSRHIIGGQAATTKLEKNTREDSEMAVGESKERDQAPGSGGKARKCGLTEHSISLYPPK